MRIRLLLWTAPLVLCVTFAAAAAYAQTGDGPGSLPPVSIPIAVTTLVSLLLGVINMIAQGSILNLVTVPKTWAGPATVMATFFTGVGSFLASAAQPWTGSTAFYALAFGLFGIFGGGLPAFALHTHTTLPRMLRAARMAAKP